MSAPRIKSREEIYKEIYANNMRWYMDSKRDGFFTEDKASRLSNIAAVKTTNKMYYLQLQRRKQNDQFRW